MYSSACAGRSLTITGPGKWPYPVRQSVEESQAIRISASSMRAAYKECFDLSRTALSRLRCQAAGAASIVNWRNIAITLTDELLVKSPTFNNCRAE